MKGTLHDAAIIFDCGNGDHPDNDGEDCYDWVGCPGTCDECEIGAEMGIEQVILPSPLEVGK